MFPPYPLWKGVNASAINWWGQVPTFLYAPVPLRIDVPLSQWTNRPQTQYI